MDRFDEQPPRAESGAAEYLPLLPVRDGAIFPYIITPLTVSRQIAIAAVEAALADSSRMIFVVSQRDKEVETPGAQDFHPFGTVAVIMRMVKFPDGRVKVLLQGLSRARFRNLGPQGPCMTASVTAIKEPESPRDVQTEALLRSVRKSLEKILSLGKGVNPEVSVIANGLEEAGQLADLVASNLDLKNEEIQEVLQTLDPVARLRRVGDLALREIQLLTMQQEIQTQVRGEIDRSQREYYLRQQMKAIQDELGEGGDLAEEVDGFRQKALDAGFPEEAAREVTRQINRLEKLHPDSAESAIVRNYVETMLGLPWNRATEDRHDIAGARDILEEDHYGLEKVKERILEYLAVRSLRPDTKGPILCFVGPPGVGKTSLGKSIARALGRKFVRISLGGVKDEAEIRGHRRTYVGAMPGRIIQGLQQAGTRNPVFMLDEVDKIGSDYRGDPSAALLEVLDPAQNDTFRDHFLGVPFDLSQVIFVATANLLEPIQPAFRDRMEVIHLSGYSEEEKLQIARRYIVPKQLEAHGLTPAQCRFTDSTLRALINGWTNEAGLRNLERTIAQVCRKVARRVAEGRPPVARLTPSRIEGLIGHPPITQERALTRPRIGVSTGLAVTAAGGDVLFVESITMNGGGNLILTGSLGDVMKESARAALSYARSRASWFGIDDAVFTSRDIHVHVPEGAIPKDGPSAGVTIATSLLSAFTGRPVRRDIAMTGEITLRGAVLAVGGIKEKVLAARRAGISHVVLPEANRYDAEDIPREIRREMTFTFASRIEDVIREALLPSDSLLAADAEETAAPPAGISVPGPEPFPAPATAEPRP